MAAAPLWLLVVPALAVLVRRRHPAALDLAVLALPYLAAVAPRREWYGAWSPPFRFGMVLLPLLALALVPLLAARRRGGWRWLLGGATALTLGLTLLWMAVPGWTYNLADGSNHLLSALDARLGADVTRFFPSFVRPRAASWIWPLAGLALLVALHRWPRRRASPAWGLALALLAGAAAVTAAGRVPTRIVELEDRWVDRQGGALHPERWREHREIYRGGWVISPGDRITVPAVAGGRRLAVDVEARLDGGSRTRLEVAAGGRPGLGRAIEGRGWKRLRFEELEWRRGDALTLELAESDGGDADTRLLLDRLRLDWK